MKVKYHPGKVNVVIDAVSRKSTGSIASLLTIVRRLLRELEALQIEIVLPKDRSYIGTLQITSTLWEKIKLQQKEDLELMKIKKDVEEGRNKDFALREDVLWYHN